MADGNETGSAGKVNPAALGVAATAVITLVGGLSLTGSVGRVLRNDPEPMAWALALVLLGAALLAAAGMPATGKPLEVYLAIIGLELTLAGLIIAGVAGVDSARQSQRPTVSAKLSEDGRHLKGKVTASSLASDAHFVTVVAGIAQAGGRRRVEAFQRVDAGPDSDGKVELPINVRIPAGRYSEVRVVAWDGEDGGSAVNSAAVARRCGRDGADAAEQTGTGCLSLPLVPIPAGPSVTAGWVGGSREADRLEVHLTSANTTVDADGEVPRVAVVVKSRGKGHEYEPIYRGAFRPDGNGDVDTKFQVPVRKRALRVCVGAKLTSAAATTIACKGTKPEQSRPRQVVVHLKRPLTAAR